VGEELAGWCRRRLGAEPVAVLFRAGYLSEVTGLRLADGREVVVKARPPAPRLRGCVAVQAALASAGFPYPRPPAGLAPVVGHADWESQNIRWRGDRPVAVHDWDSAVAQPEPVVAGLAAAVWPADGNPDQEATVEQTERFVTALEVAGGA
jgi:Ser/Thr protein kinase RdoA (MazF antagonist)